MGKGMVDQEWNHGKEKRWNSGVME
jgi:hypothetical protein